MGAIASIIGYGAGSAMCAILYSIAVAGTGWLLLQATARASGERMLLPFGVEVLTAFCIGIGFYAGLWICLGLAGHLRLAVVLPCLVPGYLGASLAMTREGQGAHLPQALERSTGWLWWGLALLLGCILVMLAIASFSPPEGDAVAIYMVWPKVIAASGLLGTAPGYYGFSNLWIVAEVHFAALMLWGGEAAAKFFVWLVLVAVVGWTRELAMLCGLGRRGRLLAVAMTLTSTAVLLVSWDGKTDLIAVPTALASVWWALALKGPARRSGLLVTGWLAGTAVAAKLSYVAPLGAMLLALILWSDRAAPAEKWHSFLRVLGGLLAVGVSAAIAMSPQFIKNLVLFGQPLWPILTFRNGHVSCCGYSAGALWYSAAVTQRIILTFPFALSFGNYWAQYGVLSPLGLGFLPFLAFWRPRGGSGVARLRWITYAGILGMAAWLALTPSQMATRYFLGPALPLLLLPAWLGEQASRALPRLLRPVIALSALVVAAGVAVWIQHSHAAIALRYAGAPPPRVAAGYEVAVTFSEIAPPGTRALLLGWYRYFFRADLIQCFASAFALEPGDYGALEDLGADYLIPSGDGVGILKRLDRQVAARLGVEYIVRHKYLSPDFIIDPQVAHIIYEDPTWSLYRIDLGGARPDLRCVATAEGRWRVERTQ